MMIAKEAERKCEMHKRSSSTCTTCRQILLDKQNADRRKGLENGTWGYIKPRRYNIGD